MSVENSEFNDPALKDAVRRCWACDCASDHLRSKVSALLKDDRPMMIAPVRSKFKGSWLIWPLAAAAVVVLSVMMVEKHSASQLASSMSLTLENNLIQTHDHCCQEADHQHLRVSINDDAGIASAMRAKLNQPVLMFHPAEAGWKFRGASICPVGNVPSGHLVYARGKDRLSIFSLPPSLVTGAKDGDQFTATVNQHAIVSFVKSGALICVVGSGSPGTFGVDQLEQMTQQMKPEVAYAPHASGRVELTELLVPVH